MPVKKRVILQKDVTCEKCKEVIPSGNEALKDRSSKSQGTKYFHTNHVK
jgi:hypothetical protein